MIFNNINYLAEDFTVRRACIAVQGERITFIGNAPPAIKGRPLELGEVVDGTNRLLIPGLVNAHSHVPMTLLRGYGEGLPLARWLNEKVFPFEDKMTAEDIYWGSLVGIAEMLASGVTSFSDMYSFCDEICEAVLLSGIKANISRGLVEFGDGGLAESFRHDESLRLIDKYHGAGDGRIITEASIHAEYTSTERIVRELAQFAQERGLGVHIHLSETRSEQAEGLARRGVTPTQYFEDCGIFSSRVTAAHCVHVTDADIEILARNNATVAHNPTSNLKLGSGIAPIPKLLAAGVNIALGTDGASSNNNLNMFEEVALAALIQRGVAENAELMPPAEVLRMATLGGAIAQGRAIRNNAPQPANNAARTGAIKVGSKADFAVLSLNKPHHAPSFDLASGLVSTAQASDVEMTVVDGRIVYRDGECLLFDVREAMEKARAAAERIASEM